MRSTGYEKSFNALCSAADKCISILAVAVGCSLSGPLFLSPPVVVFLDCGHPCFWNFNSTIPVDVVRMKSCANRLLTLRVFQWGSRSINFINLHKPHSADSVRRCKRALKGGLGTDESDVSVMLLYPV